MKNQTAKYIADTAIGTALCAVLLVISYYVPIISVFAGFLSCVPIVILCCKHNFASGVSAFVCSGIVLFFLTGNIIAVGLSCLTSLLPGLVFGIFSSKNCRFINSWIFTAFAVLLGLVVELVIINGANDGIRAVLDSAVTNAKNGVSEIIAQSGYDKSGEILNVFNTTFASMTETMIKFIPTFAVIYSAVYGYLLCMASVFFVKRLKIKNIDYVKFNMISSPKSFCFITAVLFIVLFFLPEGGTVHDDLSNLAVISEAFIGVCGFSLIDWFVSKKIKSGYSRAVIYFAVFLFGFVIMPLIADVMIIAGYIDGFLGLRKARIPGGSEDENQ